MKRTPKRLWPAWLVSLLVVGLVFAVVAGLRRVGYLQRLEFFAYDFFIKRQTPAMAIDQRIALVGVTEGDIHMPGLAYPVPDETMARLLQTIEAQGPRAIGLDIYRDIPLPDEAHRALLDQVLLSNSNIICIFRFPDASHPGVKPPAVLAGLPDRIAFNDLLIDPDGVMRRGLLYQDDGTNIFFSLDSRLALLYLAPEGIQLEPDTANPNHLRLGKGSFRPLESRDGPYAKLDTAGYQFLIDFKGPRKFETVSWSQLVGGALPADTFSNKVVIVGMTAQSIQDDKVTALDPRQRGIEVHAHIVNQLLRAAVNGEPQRAYWKEWQKDAWVLLWCLAGGAVGYAIRSPWRSYSLLSLTLLVLGGVAWRVFNAGWWIPLAAPALACMAAAVSVNWYISSQEKAQRAIIMHLFAKQVSLEVAETIWNQRNEFLEGGRPRSQKLVATVLYTDLRGYSTLSETLEPTALMDWLNEYMSMMAQAVSTHHGVIDKFIGDAVMAMFGVPLPRKTKEEIKQDAVNAVRCALEMEAALEKHNALWAQRNLPVCSMRVGIHTGPLVAGSLGSTDRMEYTVIGDTVNTASRLESFDKDYDEPELAGRRCRILVGESTWELLGGRFEAKCVGNMTLKGKSQQIMIYRVVKELFKTEEKSMKKNALRIVCLVLGLEFGLVSGLRSEQPATPPPPPAPPATEQKLKKEESPKPIPPPKPKAVFQLPLRGAPATRVDGGSRGSGVSLTCLTVLAPNGTALTIHDQPSLFWYQSQPVDTHFELTILVENTVQPLLRIQLSDARKAGIQRINLADNNVRLSIGVEYEWVVALIVDQESRSKDVIASGWIKRVEPSESLKSRVASATQEDLPSLYAAEGIWLDALAAESDLVEARPDDKPLQEERASLLEQVGLTNAADYAASMTLGQ